MHHRVFHFALVVYAMIATAAAPAGAATLPDTSPDNNPDTWWSNQADGSYAVNLYFFWTSTCPHCQQARPDVQALAAELPWVSVKSLELTDDRENGRLYARLAAAVGERPQSVPAFLFCGQMLTGYDNRAGMGQTLRQGLTDCRGTLNSGASPLESRSADAAQDTTRLPLLGEIDLSTWSLPAVAITLGALDSFNPCAFFVLLFLLSLLVNARSRARMLLIGGVFVGVSGIVYFLFMAAWLNLFLVIGQLQWITLAAGVLAIAIGGVNVKDFFYLHAGPSLSISRGAKAGLFARMRQLVGAQSLVAMLTGTLVLAVFANAYELLCTAGFPMVFTRILTLEELPLAGYYSYIALYCTVYVLPLLAIVGLFAWTLGRRKLSEHEGRVLKLMSGLMMSGLGVLLVAAPQLLNNISTTLALLTAVVVTTYVLHRFTRTN